MKSSPLLVNTSFSDFTHNDDDSIDARIRIKAVTPLDEPDFLLADVCVTSRFWSNPSVVFYEDLAMHISRIDDINALAVALFTYHGKAVREYGVPDVGADHFDFGAFLRSELPQDVAVRLDALICQSRPASCVRLTDNDISTQVFNKPSRLHFRLQNGGERA